eukprot:scaffold34439_cov56-Isochrysis_galbana.AAC.1
MDHVNENGNAERESISEGEVRAAGSRRAEPGVQFPPPTPIPRISHRLASHSTPSPFPLPNQPSL